MVRKTLGKYGGNHYGRGLDGSRKRRQRQKGGNNNKVISHFNGGLANRIIQIYAGLGYAEKWGSEYYLSNKRMGIADHVSNEESMNDLKTLFPNIKMLDDSESIEGWKKIDEGEHFKYKMIDNPNTNVILEGYFQSTKYFPQNLPLLEIPVPSNNLFDSLNKDNIYFLHIRLGDYVNTGFEIDLKKYYTNCINKIKEINPNAEFFILSNELEKAKAYIQDNVPILNNLTIHYDTSTKRLDTLYYMSQSKGGICSNSTFSWVGAFSIKNKNKDLIFIPKPWFNYVPDDAEIYPDWATIVDTRILTGGGKQMNIAIIGKFDFHLECIGFLCELLKEHNITVYVTADHKGYISFFTELFPNIKIVYFTDKLDNNFMAQYNKVFKLSSNDDVLSDSRIISILHMYNLKDVSKHYISLTPVIADESIDYMFPIYKPVINKTYDKIITYIGHMTKDAIDDDLDNLIKNSGYTFNFVIWGDKLKELLSKYPNVNVFIDPYGTKEMSELIKKSKFLLARKAPYANYDRFSGVFSLAISFSKPLIVDKKSQDIYNFPGIIFNDKYSEIISNLNLPDTEYDNLVNEVDTFKNKMLEENKIKMDKLLSMVGGSKKRFRKTRKKKHTKKQKGGAYKDDIFPDDELNCKYLSMYGIMKASKDIKNLHCINFESELNSFVIPSEPFVLFTYTDSTVPDDNMEKSTEILNSPNLLHWYAQNLVKHDNPKLTIIPIGIDYHTIAEHKSGYEWWGPKETPVQQEKLLLELNQTAKPLSQREKKLYCNFYNSINRYPNRYGAKDRADALEEISEELLINQKENIPRAGTWKKMSETAFVLSPHGNGLDCHRTWEALALGCIPIVKKSSIDPLYNNLPVLIVDNWSDINQELLDKTINDFTNKTFNLDTITYKYWIDTIKNSFIQTGGTNNIPFIFIHLGDKFFPEYTEYTFKQCKKWNPDNDIYFICSDVHKSKIDTNLVKFISISSLTQTEHHKKYNNDVKIDEGFRDGFWRFTTERLFTLEDFCLQYNITEFLHLENDNMIYFNANEFTDIFRKSVNGISTMVATRGEIVLGMMYCNNIETLSNFTKFLLENKSGSNSSNNEMVIGQKFFDLNKNTTSYLPSIPLIPNTPELNDDEKYKISNNISIFNGVFDPGQYGTWLGGIDPRNGDFKPFTYINQGNIITPDKFKYELKTESNNNKRYYIINKENNIDLPIFILHVHSKKLNEFYF